MDPTQAIVESLLALSRHLRNALEQNQIELVATLLTERQELLRILAEVLQAGQSLSEELERNLREADSALYQAAQGIKDNLGRELTANQGQKRIANGYRTLATATFVDHLS